MPAPREIHAGATALMSLLMVIIGIAMLVTTLARGGGPFALGVLLGVMFVLAGAGRIYIGRARG